ncbi:MAG: non-heme ferritin [Acuticoccus sp.]
MQMTGTGPMADDLNALMNNELRSAHLYFQASSWSVKKKLAGCAKFFLDHAEEELMHMKKILQYLADVDIEAVFEASPQPVISDEDIGDLLRSIYTHEQQVTRNFYDAVRKTEEVGDLSTYEFLRWFVAEQREEETLFRELLDRIDIIGDGPHRLLFIDTEVAKVQHA